MQHIRAGSAGAALLVSTQATVLPPRVIPGTCLPSLGLLLDYRTLNGPFDDNAKTCLRVAALKIKEVRLQALVQYPRARGRSHVKHCLSMPRALHAQRTGLDNVITPVRTSSDGLEPASPQELTSP